MSRPPRSSFPVRSIAFGLFLTSALIGVGSWNAARLYAGMKELAIGELRLKELNGIVIHLDEVLTMSARMAAETGDPVWERRYQRNEPTLDAAIKEVVALAPDVTTRADSQQTDAANRALVAMELRAFERVRVGDLEAAVAILGGADYEEQKRIYAAGVQATMRDAHGAFERRIETHRRRVVMLVAVGVALFILLIGVWVRIGVLLRSYLTVRDTAEAAPRETNEGLEARISARTHELDTMHRELATKDKLSSIGMLAAGIAHEINNPMTFVTSNVNTLTEDLKGLADLPEILQEYVDEVLPATLDGIRRVNTIVGDLRRFARGDVAGMVEYDLNGEVRAAVRISRNQLRDGCRIDVELGALPRLVGKPQQIAQTLVNLIVNAAQAVDGDGGVITVTTRIDGAYAVLAVADNGVGMSAETLGQLFQPFFTTKPVGQGTGLGLSVAYGIVKSHGGVIEVASELGRGSRFDVRLPLVPPIPVAALDFAPAARQVD